MEYNTVKPVLSGHPKIDKIEILMTNCSLMKVEHIAECSLLTCIKQLLVLKTIFGLFESGRFTQDIQILSIARLNENTGQNHCDPSIFYYSGLCLAMVRHIKECAGMILWH